MVIAIGVVDILRDTRVSQQVIIELRAADIGRRMKVVRLHLDGREPLQLRQHKVKKTSLVGQQHKLDGGRVLHPFRKLGRHQPGGFARDIEQRLFGSIRIDISVHEADRGFNVERNQVAGVFIRRPVRIIPTVEYAGVGRRLHLLHDTFCQDDPGAGKQQAVQSGLPTLRRHRFKRRGVNNIEDVRHETFPAFLANR